ncbi:3'-5' exonuclease-like [Curcuma longa]|uniref:3'-5' exonuclease-like n=1 Tax=Curcuma longa TaxID=136217 RepID=UPI003D9E940D
MRTEGEGVLQGCRWRSLGAAPALAVLVADEVAPVFTVAVDDFTIQTTVTSNGDEVEMWIEEILRIHSRRLHQLVVGLDVERRPSYSRIQHPVAVLQICVGMRCLVFQVIHTDYFPHNLNVFLGDHRFTFVGVGIQNHAGLLDHNWGLHVANTSDLRTLAANGMQRNDLRNAGLKQLADELLGLVVEKSSRVTMSNWAKNTLSHAQIAYACADAFLSFEIGKRLLNPRF